MDLDQNINKQVTIDSVARNAAAGAVVLVDDTPVYLEGLERWDSAHNGKQVTVSGLLFRESGDDVVNAAGEYAHGIPDGRFVLKSPTWKLS